MKRTRLALVSLLAFAALALVAQPVAAQTSATAQLINELNSKLLYLAVPITVIVEVILIYTVIRFKNADEPKPTRENRRLEITWTIATAIILLFVGVASYGVLANPNVTYTADEGVPSGEDSTVVYVESYQWGWNMQYPQHGNFSAPMASSGGASGPQIVVPKGQPVYFRITSTDVIHAFHVPELGLKQDAMPGSINTIRTVPYETGTYQGYCAEFCGVAHSQMYFSVKVVSQDQYQQFVQENSDSGSSSGNSTSGNQSSIAVDAPAVAVAG
jgi:cytochrome c oxidase subunit 2